MDYQNISRHFPRIIIQSMLILQSHVQLKNRFDFTFKIFSKPTIKIFSCVQKNLIIQKRTSCAEGVKLKIRLIVDWWFSLVLKWTPTWPQTRNSNAWKNVHWPPFELPILVEKVIYFFSIFYNTYNKQTINFITINTLVFKMFSHYCVNFKKLKQLNILFIFCIICKRANKYIDKWQPVFHTQ